MNAAFIIRGRAGGKTTEALEIFDANPQSLLVVINAIERDRLRTMRGGRIGGIGVRDRIVSLGDIQGGRLRGHPLAQRPQPLIIDNLDILLPGLLGFSGHPDIIVTATGTVL